MTNAIAISFFTLSVAAYFPSIAEAKSTCEVNLMLKSTHTSDTAIFDSPNGRVILKVPKALETFHGVNVIAMEKQWWKISAIYLDGGQTLQVSEAFVQVAETESSHDDGELVFGKDGKPALKTPVYAMPSYSSKTTSKMMYGVPITLIDCKGPWLKFNQVLNGKSLTGWWSPEDQCPNSVTNCAQGDSGERTGLDDMGNR